MNIHSSEKASAAGSTRSVGQVRRRKGCVAALLCASLAASASFADEYSWQLSGSGRRLEIGDALDNEGTVVDAVYYFGEVDDAQGPRALAAFLNRSSRVAAAVHREHETETYTFTPPFGAPVTSSTVTKTEGYSIAGRYVRPSKGWYAGAGYDNASTDFPSNPLSSENVEVDGYSLLLGKYFGRATTLEVTWNSTRSVTDIETFVCTRSTPLFCPPVLGFETKTNRTSLAAFHVGGAGRLKYSLGARLASSRTDVRVESPPLQQPLLPPAITAPRDGVFLPIVISVEPPVNPPDLDSFRTYTVTGELFPRERLGVRLGYSRWDGDRLRDEGYTLSTTWFFTNRVAVSFEVDRTDRKRVIQGAGGEDTGTLSVIGRF
jgi:hypothetical protein